MSDKPTVLVTGGAGYIGSHAVLALRDAGYGAVLIWYRSAGPQSTSTGSRYIARIVLR